MLRTYMLPLLWAEAWQAGGHFALPLEALSQFTCLAHLHVAE